MLNSTYQKKYIPGAIKSNTIDHFIYAYGKVTSNYHFQVGTCANGALIVYEYTDWSNGAYVKTAIANAIRLHNRNSTVNIGQIIVGGELVHGSLTRIEPVDGDDDTYVFIYGKGSQLHRHNLNEKQYNARLSRMDVHYVYSVSQSGDA